MSDTDNDIIEWGPPPDNQHRRTARFIEALKSRPGEWAKYPTPIIASGGTNYKKNYPGAEWTTRARPDGKFDLYGRWRAEVES